MPGAVYVTVSGPLLEGRAGPEIVAALEEALLVVGRQGVANAQRILDQSTRHPTGHYRSRVTVERAASDVVVSDNGVRYGPWLEGRSSRNRSTGFRGYQAFRRARQELERQAQGLVQDVVDRHLDRIR